MLENDESCVPRNVISSVLGLNINCAIYWQCDLWLQFPSLLRECDNISDVCANQNEVLCHVHCLVSTQKSYSKMSFGWNPPSGYRCCPLPFEAEHRGKVCPHSLTWETASDLCNWPWPQRHPSSLMLQTSQVRCCFDLGPQQKISLGKPSHDSWAPQWKLSVDNIEKIRSSKYSREGSMKETRCVLRIQLERNETVPDSVTFLKIKNKKPKALGELLKESPLWWSWWAPDPSSLLSLTLVNFLCNFTNRSVTHSLSEPAIRQDKAVLVLADPGDQGSN